MLRQLELARQNTGEERAVLSESHEICRKVSVNLWLSMDLCLHVRSAFKVRERTAGKV